MAKTLCLDFGNSRLKAALFEAGDLKETVVLGKDALPHIEALVQHHQPTHSILASVIEDNADIETFLKAHTQFHKLSYRSQLPFTISAGKPETIGADRLAIAAAAVHQSPARNTLVIATGTCITYNFINQQQQLMGGAISPGLHMRLRAMHDYTAKLPLVNADWNVPLIGYDTITNMQSGAVLGIAGEMDAFIDGYKKRFGNFNAVLTGGDTPFFEPHLKNGIFADLDFIFKGLYAISQINASL